MRDYGADGKRRTRQEVIRLDQCLEHSAHERAIALHDKRLEAHGGALEAAPAKRWDSVVNYALTAVLAFVVGIVATHLGINI